MKKVIVAALVLSAGIFSAKAQNTGTWNLDPAHSSLGFTVPHMVISEAEGKLKKYDITLTAGKEDFADSKLTFSGDVASLTTDNEMRDKHLAGDEFFNAEKFPKITFVSKSFKKTGEKTFKVTGALTIRDVTKDVTLDAKLGGVANDPWKNRKSGWKVTGVINRQDFGLKYNQVAESGAVVGNEVTITANVELAKAK
ncbi:MAG: YceI family protein [Bacteroidota bacterium]